MQSPGHQLLTRSVFALDEHPTVRRGRNTDQLLQPKHGSAIAYQQLLLPQLFAKVPVLTLQLLKLENVLKQKKNLIKPMLHGDKTNVGTAAPSRDDAISRLVALIVLGVCAGAVTWLVKLGE